MSLRRDKESKECGFCFTTSLIVISSFIMLWSIITTLPSLIAKQGICNVNNITYPQENTTNNFVRCSCGRGCSKDWGYCVNIELELNKVNYLANNDVSFGVNNYCTFTERNCPSNKTESIKEAYNIAKPYISLMETNKTVTCYHYDGNVYLYNKDRSNNITLMCSMIGITTVLLLLLLLYK